jgi:hypothetical protein
MPRSRNVDDRPKADRPNVEPLATAIMTGPVPATYAILTTAL